MSASMRLRTHIENLSKSLFTRRELLAVDGRRGVVDNTLAKLLIESVIERVATGVYSLIKNRVRMPTSGEIAHLRVEVFGKKVVYRIGDDPARSAKQNATSFYTDGPTTSFKSIHGRIYLKAIAPRYTVVAPISPRPAPITAPIPPLKAVLPKPECPACAARRSSHAMKSAQWTYRVGLLELVMTVIRRLLARLHPR